MTSAAGFEPKAWHDGRGFVQGQVYLADDRHVSEALKSAFGMEVKKSRPIVILQNDRLNSVPQVPVILVAPLTSQARVMENDYVLRADGKLLEKDSVVQLSLLQPIPKRALTKFIGKVSGDDLRAIKELLRRKFAL